MSESGIEPLTHGFSVHCSTTELPGLCLKSRLHLKGFEPLTYSLEGYCSSH